MRTAESEQHSESTHNPIVARPPRTLENAHFAPISAPDRPSESAFVYVALDGEAQKCALTRCFAQIQPMWRFAEFRVEIHGTVKIRPV